MKRIAFVDLDGVVADNTERFKRAESRKDWHNKNLRELLKPELESPVNASYVQKSMDDLLETFFWQRAFGPELVALDTLIDGAVEAISAIECHPSDWDGYNIIYLTSRPESMREATYKWLFGHQVSGPRLIMKAPAFQFTKTLTWKVGMVQTLVALYEDEEILFVDDEQAHRDAIMDAFLGSSLEITVASSLAEAIKKLKEEQ